MSLLRGWILLRLLIVSGNFDLAWVIRGLMMIVVRFLRRLADAGQAILCTIHQPSAVLFEMFDDLILLQSGGRTVYNGELGTDSSKLIQYFEQNGGKKCPEDANPAEVRTIAIKPFT